MAKTFGTLDFATSFTPISAFPLNGNEYFEDLAQAQAAAASAKPAGDTTTKYYFGQTLCVVTDADTNNAVAKLYYISPKEDNGNVVGELKEIGSGAGAQIDIDTNQFVLTDGKLNLLDFATAVEGAQLVKTDGKVKWVKPDNTTVEGLSTAMQTVQGRIDALEAKVATSLNKTIVENLPDVGDATENTIYMVKDETATGADKYKEYVLIDGALVCIGDTSTDLSGVLKGIQVNSVDVVAVDGKANIPVASNTALGVVKGSDEIGVDAEGTVSITKLNINKLDQQDDDVLILVCGTAAG